MLCVLADNSPRMQATFDLPDSPQAAQQFYVASQDQKMILKVLENVPLVYNHREI